MKEVCLVATRDERVPQSMGYFGLNMKDEAKDSREQTENPVSNRTTS